MVIYESLDEIDLSYDECISWLTYNDPNGCYTRRDQLSDMGELLSLDEMKSIILSQCSE